LDKRAQELKDLETRVKAEHAELLQLTQTVWQLRQDFEKDIVKIKEEEVSNLKKLAKIYSTMSPEGAAKIMAELPDDMIVKVLVFMKESESAQILEVLGKSSSTEAKRVAMITEMLRLASQKVATNKTI
jgi:flagellar motility protein MotE (MotC chaperone)